MDKSSVALSWWSGPVLLSIMQPEPCGRVCCATGWLGSHLPPLLPTVAPLAHHMCRVAHFHPHSHPHIHTLTLTPHTITYTNSYTPMPTTLTPESSHSYTHNHTYCTCTHFIYAPTFTHHTITMYKVCSIYKKTDVDNIYKLCRLHPQKRKNLLQDKEKWDIQAKERRE